MSVLLVQQKLKLAGYDPGPIDGMWGKRTSDALDDALGLKAGQAGVEQSALADALKVIKRWEGCKLTAYPDPGTGGEPITIGWGSTGPGIHLGLKWSQEQADARLAGDVDRFMAGVSRLLTRKPLPHQLGAMTSLAYNIGLGAFAKSTLLKKFNAGEDAAPQFDVWNKAGGRVMQGLVNRRADERKLYEGKA